MAGEDRNGFLDRADTAPGRCLGHHEGIAAAAAAMTATEYEPSGKAAEEVRELYEFVTGELRKIDPAVSGAKADAGRLDTPRLAAAS